jgi:hypothetical protein
MEPASTGGFGYHRVEDRAGGPAVIYTEVPAEDPTMDFPVTLDLRR